VKNVAIMDGNVVVNVTLCGDDYVLSENEIEYFDDKPAFINGDYVDGYFYGVQPFPSWTRNEGVWIPPVPRPETRDNWYWDEEKQEFSIYNG
jgi:hypothetical protein